MTKNQERRKEEAEVRKAERAARTPQQQLARLDDLLGKGQGAVKERARLAAAITNKKEPSVASKPKSEEKFFVKIDGKPIAIQSCSQLRRLGAQRGFDPKPYIQRFRNFKKRG